MGDAVKHYEEVSREYRAAEDELRLLSDKLRGAYVAAVCDVHDLVIGETVVEHSGNQYLVVGVSAYPAMTLRSPELIGVRRLKSGAWSEHRTKLWRWSKSESAAP